jgi:hypothetical protein
MSRGLLPSAPGSESARNSSSLRPLSDPGDRGGHREQRLLLTLAQYGLHLARVLATRPRQHERGHRQQQ